ncbi:unnamed protein product [Closterium sp. NIES-64]|nr:unnamed protein product [Closterium sp. NIES-64]
MASSLRWTLAACVLLSALALVACKPPPRPVQVNNQIWIKGFGPIQGTGCPGFTNVSAFYGVPYALPPTGKLRFAAPVMWDKQYPFPYRRADTPPPKCPQPYRAVTDNIRELIYSHPRHPSPPLCTAGLSVHEHFHAGERNGEQHGGARAVPTAGGSTRGRRPTDFVNRLQSVAETNTTLVIVQVPPGALGFPRAPLHLLPRAKPLATGGCWTSRWRSSVISKYIGYFGGNSSVQIMGHNAGAHTAARMSGPLSKDLFTSAVASNGAAIPLFTQNRAYDSTYTLAEALNCPLDPETQLECLRQPLYRTSVPSPHPPAPATRYSPRIPVSFHSCTRSSRSRSAIPHSPAPLVQTRWQDIVAKTPVVKDIYRQQRRIFYPCIDGKVIPQQPLDMLSNGQLNPAPLMMVTNKDEGRLYVLESFGKWWQLNETSVKTFLANVYPGVDPAQIIQHYWIKLYDSVLEQYADMWTDIYINCPAYKTLVALSAYQFPPFDECAYPSPFYMGYGAPCKLPLHLYYFAVRSPCPAASKFLGATSKRDLPYLFNLEAAQTGCSFDQNETALAYDTTYATGTMANLGKPCSPTTRRGLLDARRPDRHGGRSLHGLPRDCRVAALAAAPACANAEEEWSAVERGGGVGVVVGLVVSAVLMLIAC